MGKGKGGIEGFGCVGSSGMGMELCAVLVVESPQVADDPHKRSRTF